MGEGNILCFEFSLGHIHSIYYTHCEYYQCPNTPGKAQPNDRQEGNNRSRAKKTSPSGSSSHLD